MLEFVSETVELLQYQRCGFAVLQPQPKWKDVLSGLAHAGAVGQFHRQLAPRPVHVQGAGAVWHIWRRADLDTLRRFMRENQEHFEDVTSESGHVELLDWEDPVHSQRFMLTDALLEKLLNDTGVQPWQFEQNLGEAVFIPAGCAHQVRRVVFDATRGPHGELPVARNARDSRSDQ